MTVAPIKPRRFDRDVDGILLLDKPVGISSNAALQKARAAFRALKAGHAGSLDPLASGMLPVCFGQATKICAFLLDARKTYRFTARLGERTDTGDAEGTVIERGAIPQTVDDERIRSVLASLLGEQQQIPPMYSALKHEGERLYTLARRGETVERAPRRIVIEQLDLERFTGTEFEVVVRCSKGTYVRTLAEDIARGLGTLAHLTALRRLQVDPFTGQSMLPLETLLESTDLERLDSLLIPPDQALPHLLSCEFSRTGEESILKGQCAMAETAAQTGDYVRIYGAEGRFLGLGQMTPEGTVQPRRLLVKSTINP